MFILFTLIVMRMSGAMLFNPIFGRNNIPRSARAALIFTLSLLLYLNSGGVLVQEPQSMLEYMLMLLLELLFGFVIGFIIELALLVIRFATAVMDYAMGLSMAQVYDPQYNMQTTVSQGLYYGFLMLLFFAVNGHIKLIEIFYASAGQIPFGTVGFSVELSELIIGIFGDAVLMGLKMAFPLIAMELLTEFAVGILMRIIPQINVFVINFQLKIIVGLLMLLVLFSPIADQLEQLIGQMFRWIQESIPLMG